MLLTVMTTALNSALRLDEDRAVLLAELHGKKLGVELLDWNLAWTLIPQEDAFQMLANTETADVVLTGKLRDFLALMCSEVKTAELAKGKVSVQGDIHVLSAYQSLFQRLDLNWQSVFARYVGPDLGGLCSSLLKACSQFTRRQTQITAKNLTEVLQEEKRLLVPREELEDFFKDIKTLQMDVDRMEARYKTLA